MSYTRKSVYLCRAAWCKKQNVVWERVDADNNVIETAQAWEHKCGFCGRGSLDLSYQVVLRPETTLEEESPSASWDERRRRVSRPISEE